MRIPPAGGTAGAAVVQWEQKGALRMHETERTILVVDDEAELREMVRAIFTRAGYGRVVTAATGAEALAICRDCRPDIVILDVMLPGMDGFAVLRALRQDSDVPVLMLTARSEAEDKFTGFECGADDYLAKPFLPRELLFRVQAILRRAGPGVGRPVQLAAASVDLDNAAVHRDGQVYPLTAKELQLFRKLYENAGRIVTTGALCAAICGPVWQGYESTLATHIRHLREKVEANPSRPVSIVTIKGLGYRLDLPREAAR